MFAWTTRTKQFPLANGRVLLLKYSCTYVGLFSFLHGKHWFLISDKRSEDREISAAEAQALLEPNTVVIPWRERYGGLIALLVFAVLLVVGFWVSE